MTFCQGFRKFGIEPLLKARSKQASKQASNQASHVPSQPGRATVVFADYAPTNHLGSDCCDWHLRVLAWRIIGGVESSGWSEWSELRQMQIWMIDSASIFAAHCRQAEANFQYVYGTNSPSLLPTSLSFSHSSKPLAVSFNLLLYYTHIPICPLLSSRCGIRSICGAVVLASFPHVPRLEGCRFSTPPGVHPLYHHPKSLSKPQRPEEFSNT
jgi:hypothetical protein